MPAGRADLRSRPVAPRPEEALLSFLIRFVGFLLLLIALAIAARRLTEREARVPPPRPGERDTVVDGVRWRSKEAPGEGAETVVYVHGFLSSSTTWRKVLSSASGGRPAIAVDLPGCGFSDRPWPYDYTVGAQALHLWRYLDARDVRRVVLVGNSLGGAVVLLAAALKPDRVAAMVLVDSAWPRLAIPWQFRLMRAPLAGDLEMELLSRPVMSWMLRYRVYSRPERVTQQTVSDWWDPVPVPGTRRAALSAIRSSPRGYEDVTNRITSPTLVLWGKEDRMLRLSWGVELAQKIRDARFLALPDAGHVPQEETPKEFTAAVVDFLRHLSAMPARREE